MASRRRNLVWEGGQFGPDGSCLVTGDGYIIVYGDTKLVIVDSSAKSPTAYKELARRQGICPINSAWPHVVFTGFRIYCKDKQGNITCFDVQA